MHKITCSAKHKGKSDTISQLSALQVLLRKILFSRDIINKKKTLKGASFDQIFVMGKLLPTLGEVESTVETWWGVHGTLISGFRA